MPRQRNFPLFERPRSYGFERVDELMEALRAGLPDINVFADVVAALLLEGPQLDVDQLTPDVCLDPRAAEIIEQLAVWSDRGEQIHHFASVRIASISAGSLFGPCDLSTVVVAQWHERGVALFFEDENGGQGDLGVFAQPLSLIELIVVIDGVLLRQAPYDVTGGDWRTGYLCDLSMMVHVSSSCYRALSVWYEQAITEWIAAYAETE